MKRRAGALALALIPTLVLTGLAGCGREPSSRVAPDPNAARSDEVARDGDIALRASAIQTRLLSPAIAQRYGAAHDERTVLVVVSLRQGDDATAVALPARVTVVASDLLGRDQALAMREMRDGELLDYVGVATVSPPETLRFEVVAIRADGKRQTLRFHRDFF
ncbi:DUF4426 domain-containing protein [Lysobacter sp. BMK333-48F3]|uniref:DUF4426 domain-containing protein n=1 Tax=Lysobacter sp. BMK333-48F3 TaxID=2867962 RepID=UPI001C8B2CDA|nr:DUF4426 domain-containing protein [Lysobacter sp. BMK333-48F3]MBX9399797.1 DUF4426 domain-containing protein [Lysobacter sp. BMK333-48F3]